MQEAAFIPEEERTPMEEKKQGERQEEKQEYFRPKVIHTERVEGRAVVCAMGDESTCGAGPIQS